MARFSQVGDELQIDDGAGALLWSGKPLGGAVALVLPGLKEDYCVVLLDPDANSRGASCNLLRVSSSGAVEWQARLPTTGADCFVCAGWADRSLVASSWSGHRLVIDTDTGEVVSSAFTK